uniref:Uncharacterized protein n=1 Tax=Anguilla anguilla TaxID=7936 RepID=A0A0E9XA77_ANGAN
MLMHQGLNIHTAIGLISAEPRSTTHNHTNRIM